MVRNGAICRADLLISVIKWTLGKLRSQNLPRRFGFDRKLYLIKSCPFPMKISEILFRNVFQIFLEF